MGLFEKQALPALRRRAARLGACRKALDQWPRTREELCEFYFAYIGFCIEHDFPTCEYLKRHFDGLMQQHHIFVEGEFERDDIVRILSPEGAPLGVGRISCDSATARRNLGRKGLKPLIHCDYLYLE